MGAGCGRGFSDDARALLQHVWALMGMPCGKYLVVMCEVWLPLLAEAGDLDKPFATEQALAELKAMNAATVDRYLKPARGPAFEFPQPGAFRQFQRRHPASRIGGRLLL